MSSYHLSTGSSSPTARMPQQSKRSANLSATPRRNPNYNTTTQSLPPRTPTRLPHTPVRTPRRAPLPPCNDSTKSTVTPLRLPRRAGDGEPRTPSFYAVRERRNNGDSSSDEECEKGHEHVVRRPHEEALKIINNEPEEGFIPFDEDAIAATPKKEDNDKWLQNFGIDVSLLQQLAKKHEAILSNRTGSDLSDITGISSLTNTPARKNTPFRLNPPHQHPTSSYLNEVDDENDENEDEGVEQNMEERKNKREEFSKENEKDVIVNENENRKTSASRVLFADNPPSRIPRPRKRSELGTKKVLSPSPKSSMPSSIPPAIPSAVPLSTDTSTSAVSSHRRRRTSRVSLRELRELRLDNDNDITEDDDENKKFTEAVGSSVFLTPLRASRKQREVLGTDTVVTPVRRSIRLSSRLVPPTNKKEGKGIENKEEYTSVPIAPAPHSAQRAELLSKSDYAFAPNRNLTK